MPAMRVRPQPRIRSGERVEGATQRVLTDGRSRGLASLGSPLAQPHSRRLGRRRGIPGLAQRVVPRTAAVRCSTATARARDWRVGVLPGASRRAHDRPPAVPADRRLAREADRDLAKIEHRANLAHCSLIMWGPGRLHNGLFRRIAGTLAPLHLAASTLPRPTPVLAAPHASRARLRLFSWPGWYPAPRASQGWTPPTSAATVRFRTTRAYGREVRDIYLTDHIEKAATPAQQSDRPPPARFG